MMTHQKRTGLTVVELLFIIGVVVIGVAFLLPNVRTAREPARRSTCKNNLKQIALAFHNYHDAYGSLPPAVVRDADGQPLHSWRTLLLPFLDEQALYAKIDLAKPWDDPANEDVLAKCPAIYQCPSAAVERNATTYVAIVTPESVFPPDGARTIREFADGTSQTLLVYETTAENAVPWMQPVDSDLAALQALRSQEDGLAHVGGFQAAFGDGTVRFLSINTPDETLHGLSTVAGGEDIGEY